MLFVETARGEEYDSPPTPVVEDMEPVATEPPAETVTAPTVTPSIAPPVTAKIAPQVADEAVGSGLPKAANQQPGWKPTARAAKPLKTVENDELPPFAFDVAPHAAKPLAAAGSAGQPGVASMAPAISVKTTGPGELLVGSPATFRVVITNTGQAASELVVEVALPTGVTDVKSSPQCLAISDERLRFEIGDMAANTTRTLTIGITPTTRGQARLQTSISLASSSSLAVAVKQSKLQLNITGPSKATYGQPMTFTVVVINAGDAPCRNINVQSLLPEGVEEIADAGVSRQIPLLESGAKKQIRLNAIAKTVGDIDLEFVATAENNIRATAAASVEISRPLIEVSTEGPAVNYLEREGVYAIVVANMGDSEAKNVQVVSAIPAGLEVVAIDRPADFNRTKQTLSWTFPTIAVGEQEVMRFKAITKKEGRLVHDVLALGEGGVRAKARHVTDVISRSDVSMQVADTAGPILVGKPSVFEVLVRNRGTSEARNVVIRAELPDGLGAVRSNDYQAADGEVRFPVTSLKPGEKKVYRFEAVSNTAGDHIVKFKLSADSLSREVLAEESVFYYQTGRERVANRP